MRHPLSFLQLSKEWITGDLPKLWSISVWFGGEGESQKFDLTSLLLLSRSPATSATTTGSAFKSMQSIESVQAPKHHIENGQN